MTSAVRWLGRSTALTAAVGAAGYCGYAAASWLRYGRRREGADPLLDPFLSRFEVEERQSVRVHAPAALTMAVALDSNLEDSLAVRAIVRAREIAMGATGPGLVERRGLLANSQAMGWRVLAQDDRSAVVGAVTQPWEANVVFHGLPPQEFAEFQTPGYAKILWSIGVEPVHQNECILYTATRVATTSAEARRRFRNYWALISPGVRVIRWAILWRVRRLAMRQWLLKTRPQNEVRGPGLCRS